MRKGIEFHERQSGIQTYRKHDSELTKFEYAIGAVVADLLRAQLDRDAQGWVFRSMKAETFTQERVSHRTFKAVVEALTGIQILVHVPGRRH